MIFIFYTGYFSIFTESQERLQLI